MKLLGLLVLEMLAGFAVVKESDGSITIEHLFDRTGGQRVARWCDNERMFCDGCHTSPT